MPRGPLIGRQQPQTPRVVVGLPAHIASAGGDQVIVHEATNTFHVSATDDTLIIEVRAASDWVDAAAPVV